MLIGSYVGDLSRPPFSFGVGMLDCIAGKKQVIQEGETYNLARILSIIRYSMMVMERKCIGGLDCMVTPHPASARSKRVQANVLANRAVSSLTVTAKITRPR